MMMLFDYKYRSPPDLASLMLIRAIVILLNWEYKI